MSLRIPLEPPLILPLASDVQRPLWSVMIPVYNCSGFLKEALSSVLTQDLGRENMQIRVVDDASTDDDIEAIVASFGTGRVEYFRQSFNVGSLRNFETCLNQARGRLIHLLHGDDRVNIGFYAKIGSLFERYPTVGAAFSSYVFIDETGAQTHRPPFTASEGILQNWLLRIAEHQLIQYVSMVVRREVYEKLGSFYGTNYGEDWEMWVRIARFFPVAYTPEILAEYRSHENSISSMKARSGYMVPDLVQVIARIQHHISEKDKRRIAKLSGHYYAKLSIGTTYKILQETNDWSLANHQIKQSLDLSRHPSVYFHLLKFYLKFLLKKK